MKFVWSGVHIKWTGVIKQTVDKAPKLFPFMFLNLDFYLLDISIKGLWTPTTDEMAISLFKKTVFNEHF